jgi:hypothetical protein
LVYCAPWANTWLGKKKKGTPWEFFLEKETWDQTSFTTKFGGKTNLGPIYFPLLKSPNLQK